MNRIFYDTEFLENGSTIELISIGMVADDGRELYAVNADMPWRRIMHHDWLRQNVAPSLPVVRHDGIRWYRRPFLDRRHPNVMPRAQLTEQVQRFIAATPDPELWAYYGAYDHVALCQLWGRMIDLPDGVPMFTHELMQLWENAGRPEMPPQKNEHDALADARWNRELWRVCTEHQGGA